ARGSALTNDFSRFRIALPWTVHNRDSSRSGSSVRRVRACVGCAVSSQSVSGRGKSGKVEDAPATRVGIEAVGEVRYCPVRLEQKGRGRLCPGRLSGKPAAYLADWASTPVSVPAVFASTAPIALR